MSLTLGAIGLGIGKLAKKIKDRKAGGLIDQGIDTGLGMGMYKWKQNQQLEQAQKLQEQQIEGQKEIGEFNQGLAIDTWNATASPQAQRTNLEKAGLNAGLMYSGAGGGAGAKTEGAGGVGGQATYAGNDIGMALQMGMENRLNQAQIDNINADTELKKTEVKKRAGVDTKEAESRIGLNFAEMAKKEEETKNLEAARKLMELDAIYKQLEIDYIKEANPKLLEQLDIQNNKAKEELDKLKRENKIGEATYKDTVAQMQLRTVQMQLENEILKLNKDKTVAEIAQLKQLTHNAAVQIILERQKGMQAWWELKIERYKLDQNNTKLILDKIQTDFNTGEAAKEKRESEINLNKKNLWKPK